jgi:hypothetical protein
MRAASQEIIEMTDGIINDTATVESTAIRVARLAASLLTPADAKAACARAQILLEEWQKEQPHPHT